MMKMYEMTSRLVERMRWKAHFFDERESGKEETERSKFERVFQTKVPAPRNKLLDRFEDDLYDFITSIKFRRYSNKLMEKMKNDLEQIESSDHLFVFADKTLDMYRI